MKYCGAVTLFWGLRVYARSAMDMLGSEIVLKEFMCRILGERLKTIESELLDTLFAETPYFKGGDFFFNAKLCKCQANWLLCEVEALSISAATKHFSPYIIQSAHNTFILTNKACIQIYEKLGRGEFSASLRVSPFLSTVNCIHANVSHFAGLVKLVSEFSSCNAPDCMNPSFQIRVFVKIGRATDFHEWHP